MHYNVDMYSVEEAVSCVIGLKVIVWQEAAETDQLLIEMYMCYLC